MKIAFTICSNNYLAQAITLGKSIIQKNNDVEFYIGLLDKRAENIHIPENIKLVTVDEVVNEEILSELSSKLNIVELNTSVKPSYFKYFINNFPATQRIYYIDPDIEFYQPLNFLNDSLEEYAIILTPHFFTPIPLDDRIPGENIATNYGMYNLGFLGINPKFIDAIQMLDWWEERCLKNCIIDLSNGIFVDQLVMNHVPLFFRHVCICDNKGLNMGPWNLHERRLTYNTEESKLINLDTELIFYHFSSYDVLNPNKLSKWYNRHDLNDDELLKKLYLDYASRVVQNGYFELSKIPCYFVKQKKQKLLIRVFKKIIQVIKK